MVSGSFESITIDGKRYTCKADDTVEITYDGYENEVNANGDGTMRTKKTRQVGKIEGLNLVIDSPTNYNELKTAQDKKEFVTISGTLVDGTVVDGTMQITDAVKLDTAEGTVEVSLAGRLESMQGA